MMKIKLRQLIHNMQLVYNSLRFMEFNNNVKITTSDGEFLTTDKLYYDLQENEWFSLKIISSILIKQIK